MYIFLKLFNLKGLRSLPRRAVMLTRPLVACACPTPNSVPIAGITSSGTLTTHQMLPMRSSPTKCLLISVHWQAVLLHRLQPLAQRLRHSFVLHLYQHLFDWMINEEKQQQEKKFGLWLILFCLRLLWLLFGSDWCTGTDPENELCDIYLGFL